MSRFSEGVLVFTPTLLVTVCAINVDGKQNRRNVNRRSLFIVYSEFYYFVWNIYTSSMDIKYPCWKIIVEVFEIVIYEFVTAKEVRKNKTCTI